MTPDPNTILLVDDEQDILEFLSYNLKNSGYNVLTATNGPDAIKIAEEQLPGLIILDVMMPAMDGIETCQALRNITVLKNTIIAMFSARTEDYTQLAGFEAGADDYIKKPIRPSVLSSRVKALLRRMLTEDSSDPQIISLKEFTIDKERYVILKEGKEIYLPKKEFELLIMFTSKPNKVFSREEIMERIWGGDVVVGDRTIDVHIRKIREKVGLGSIRTYKGIGYSYYTP
ncbi:MAG: response regulator transcription factor [Bacteroidales bacterium]|nr:response regulator transcription factor [Bacteroidales bacterium]